MLIEIKNTKASSVFMDNVFYETKKPIEVPFSIAMKLSKRVSVDFIDFASKEYNPEHWNKDKYLIFSTNIDAISGWGNLGYSFLKYSPDLRISLSGNSNGINDSISRRALSEEIREDGACVWWEQPSEKFLTSPFKKNISILMFETTLVPPSWVARLNTFSALIVPCKQNKKMFEDSRVKIPIHVAPLGVDLKRFYPLERSNKTFTFGHMGFLSTRKGTDMLVKAFLEAFPNKEDVKLICKTSHNQYHYMVKDKRIEVQIGPVTHEELIENFFKKIDCFVFPTKGEGFGYPPIEAMATGVPAICTGWSGPEEFLDKKDSYILDYKLIDAEDFTKNIYKEDCGQWAMPDYNQLVKYLRHCYTHQDEVKEKGAMAAKRVAKDWGWEKRIKEYHKIIDKYLK
jgi:glycosyltransferase involved in cell wall biosynthesis